MRENFSLVYICPYCKSPLDIEKDLVVNGEVREGMLWCTNDQKQFPIRKGIPRLLVEMEQYSPVTAEVESRGERHIVVEDPELLPQHKTLKNKKEWEMRELNFKKLQTLVREENKKRILDLGSGNCWLASRLSPFYEVFALDSGSGPTGLELSDLHLEENYFERLQADPTNLPLGDKSFDVVICSAALNTHNPTLVIGEITRVLKEDGTLFIFDSEIYSTPEGAREALEESKSGFYPIYKRDLDKELKHLYDVRYFYADYGVRHSVKQHLKSLLTRKEYPGMPIIRARRK